MPIQKVVLIIMDGLGEAANSLKNAVTQAKKPNLDFYLKEYPNVLLSASGNAVGLPEGVMGASEPGHLTMGAGRVVWQPLEEINQAILHGQIFQKRAFLNLFGKIRQKNKPLHLIGMLSDAGVHSHIKHLEALLQMAKHEGCRDVFVHIITDGRDVPERSAQVYLEEIETYMQNLGVGQIASMVGRYYAMDRDQNWDRTQVAYDLYTTGKGKEIIGFKKALVDAYQTIDTDYYLPAYRFEKFKSIEAEDGVIFFNFRSDRASQLTHALVDEKFEYFTRPFVFNNFVAMGPYTQNAEVAFPPAEVKNNLGSWLAQKDLTQLRIAETEKYAHVTFFFNSQESEPYPGEERILVHSPKCRTYAEKPEMSAYEVTAKVIEALSSQKYDAVILNYANPDLVGHSGEMKATIKAVEVVDECVGTVVQTALKNNYQVILTADHGNAEQMFYADEKTICPAHTIDPVRCYLIGKNLKNLNLKKGLGLSAIAPTMLKMMGVEKPVEMTEETLF